eukprot:6193111-Pleurochrysis_carterae.AAC.2
MRGRAWACARVRVRLHARACACSWASAAGWVRVHLDDSFGALVDPVRRVWQLAAKHLKPAERLLAAQPRVHARPRHVALVLAAARLCTHSDAQARACAATCLQPTNGVRRRTGWRVVREG